jgi:hypothetical protein
MVWPSTLTVATHQRTAETASAALPRPPTTGSAPGRLTSIGTPATPSTKGTAKGKAKT